MEVFQYDAEEDQYICPQGYILPLWSRRKSEEMYVYPADAKLSNAFPVKLVDDGRSKVSFADIS